MPTTSAATLVSAGDAALAALLTRTDAFPDAPLGSAYHDRSVSDVLAHLHEWHQILMGWIEKHRAGSLPVVPAPGYTWAQLDDLNEAIYQEFKDRPYTTTRSLLAGSHGELSRLLDTFTDQELTSPDAFAWLGGQTLGLVAHDCLAGHYAWAEVVLDAAGVAA